MGSRYINKIDERAAGWIAKVERGLTPEESAELDAWLSCDDRHFGAYCRMQAFALHTERSAGLGAGYRSGDFRKRFAEPSRRKVIGAGAAAFGAAAAAGGAAWFVDLNGRYLTRLGEVRLIPLADGTIATLNTDSAIKVNYTRRGRSVRLLKGEVLFDVAKDPERPFLVSTDRWRVRAVGTRFSVRHLGPSSPTQVLVEEGVVQVDRPSVPANAGARLPANTRAIADGDALTVAPVQSGEVERELVWRDGRISFDRQTLAEASQEFARYSDTRIVVDDPILAREQISGLYRANDPVGFSRAVAVALGARVETDRNQVRLLR